MPDYALIYSVNNGHFEIVKYLITHGANDNNEYTLIESAKNGHLDIVKYLVEHGADIHTDDDKAFRVSAINGHLDVVKFLIKNGADIHSGDDEALKESIENGHVEVVKSLVTKGVDIGFFDFNDFIYNLRDNQVNVLKYFQTIGVIDKNISTKALQFQKHGEPPFFGCELEITFDNDTEKYSCYKKLLMIKNNNFMMVKDSSITNGFEIVTNIFGYREQILLFKKVLDIVNKYKGKCDSSCGLHIHVDKTTDIENKIKSLFGCLNQNTLELIGLRSLNNYCKMNQSDWSKYHAVNIEGHTDTIEFRVFRCTLRLKNIIRYLNFAKNIVLLDEDELKRKYCS